MALFIKWKNFSGFRGPFNGLCALILLFLFFHQEKAFFPISGPTGSGRRRVMENMDAVQAPTLCSGLHRHEGYESHCEFLRANPLCTSGGLFAYLNFFYCDCKNYSSLGYFVLAVWLAALFYLLGNTAADYFCCCLEKLSFLLRLPPTVAGVTLLPFGNGAPDVFATIAAFVGTDNGDVGLNSILGGAVFVTCIVVGTICLCVADLDVQIDKVCFIRDVCIFLLALVSLAVILIIGEVTVGAAIAFVSIYVVYATFVAANEVLRQKLGIMKLEACTPLLPVSGGGIITPGNRGDGSLRSSLTESEFPNHIPHLDTKLPHWIWASNVAIYSNELNKACLEDNQIPLWGWNEDEEEEPNENSALSCSKLCTFLEIPLMLPRRLTIPIVEKERWSKGYAVASVTLAPVLLALLWNTRNEGDILSVEITYVVGAIVGGLLGVLAIIYTKNDQPPEKFLFLWVLGGFFMSIIWFYMIANELVALLVALGLIFGINPSILGLTVLAWGNSMGDLMSNVALATNGGDGVQIAISGCYAGPMFNTLAGLGISFVLGSWSKRPGPYIIHRDIGLYYNIGFLILGLLWSLIILPRNHMQPTRLLGMGLMAIYLLFLCCRIGMAITSGSLDGST